MVRLINSKQNRSDQFFKLGGVTYQWPSDVRAKRAAVTPRATVMSPLLSSGHEPSSSKHPLPPLLATREQDGIIRSDEDLNRRHAEAADPTRSIRSSEPRTSEAYRTTGRICCEADFQAAVQKERKRQGRVFDEENIKAETQGSDFSNTSSQDLNLDNASSLGMIADEESYQAAVAKVRKRQNRQ